jgi:glycosyltransferase involved in cell wall biosynthesis
MAPYLEDTIVSVLANLAEGDEYFVIDGGSTDGSVDIIRRYQDRITGWISEKDGGYADALGKGFDRATGNILCWINAGDLYLSGAFDAARKLLTDDLDLIFGDDFYIGEDSRVISHSRGWVPDLRMATLFGAWSPLQDACFWRRELYERVGGIDRALQYAADYDLFLRMSLVGRSSYVPVTFSAFRRHKGQKSISGATVYDVERHAVRSRVLASCKCSRMHRLLRGVVHRSAMSVRARLAPWVWRKPALVGQIVTELASGAY